MKYIYTEHFLNRFNERFPSVINVNFHKEKREYFLKMNEILNASREEKAFYNDINRLFRNNIDFNGRNVYLINDKHKILFCCVKSGENNLTVLTCIYMESNRLIRYSTHKNHYRTKKKKKELLMESELESIDNFQEHDIV